MEEQRVDLLLVGLMNCESWEKKIIRALYTTPRHFYRRNFLSQDNCTGPGIFGDVMLDYGPVDYLAYIGCQIYTKPFFKELCGIKISDPLYSLPLGTLELSERHKYNIGFYHDVVLHRIDVLNFGPTDGRNPPDWWVEKSRTLRGLSANLSMAVVSGSRDLSDSAFAKLANANTVAIRRAEPVYIYWNFLSSIIRQFLGTFIQSQKDPTHRYAPSEVADIVHFGARLEKVDLRMPDGNQAKLCDWLKRFGVTAGSDIPAIQQWIMESAPVFAAADARPQTGLWFVKKAG